MKLEVLTLRFDLENLNLQQSLGKVNNNEAGYFQQEIQYKKFELQNLLLKVVEHSKGRYIYTSTINNGVVASVNYHPGDILDPERPVLSIYDLDTLCIEVKVPERRIQEVKIGANVKIVPIADKCLNYKGEVYMISSLAYKDTNDTYFIVKIKPTNRSINLVPNQNVEVVIEKWR